MNKNSKGAVQLLLLLTLALIAFVGIGYYAYKNGQIKLTSQQSISPTPNPTADWNTYVNSKYAYSIRYPKAWQPNRGPGNLPDSELSKQRDIDFYDPTLPGEDPGTGLAIQVNRLDATGTNRNCSDLNDCYSKTFSWLTGTTTINKSLTSFLGQQAIIFNYQRHTALYSQSWKYIYFIYNENAYSINISTNITREEEIFSIFNQILSTFQFID